MTNNDYKQYTPLVHKLTRKYYEVNSVPYNDIYSMALEGLVRGFDNFNGNGQLLAFLAQSIRYSILCGLSDESRIVRLPYSRILKDKQEDVCSSRRAKIEYHDMYDDDDYIDISMLIEFVEREYSERDSDVFLSFYGIREKLSGTELAKKYGISNSTVTQINKKIIKKLAETFNIEDFYETC